MVLLLGCHTGILMGIQKGVSQLNIPKHCREYGLSLWQCPQFLFLVMGVIIIVTSIATYAIGIRYVENPTIIALIVLFLTTILFIIAFAIIQGFEKLAEASRLKSEFISVVSHQLRTPLANLKWTIELLMSGRLGKIEEEQLEYFKILKENNDRMAELISDLLTVSRLEQRTLPLRKQETSLEELAQDLILEFQPFLRASNIQIELSAQKDLPKIHLDPFQIRLVIENLLDNAIRYIPARQSPEADSPMAGGKEKGEIKIKLERKGKNVYFEIKDNGVGIPNEDRKYIFQKFFRSENALKRQTKGSGLGLYIAKAIIEKSGGAIGFESEENKGSTFWLTLPIK